MCSFRQTECGKMICGRREMVVLFVFALTGLGQLAYAKVTEGKEIALRRGQNATIVCNKTFMGINKICQDFHMHINGSATRVPQSDILHNDNETLYFYYLTDLEPQTTSYECECRGTFFAKTTVYVDGELPEVKVNFTSYDFANITGWFVQPYMATKLTYAMSYTGAGNQRKTVNCSNHVENTYRIITNCTIAGDTFVETTENLELELTGTTRSNVSRTQTIMYNNLDNMIPARPGPVDSRQTVVTKDSIFLSWPMPKRVLYTHKGLIWNITVTPRGFAVPLSSAHVKLKENPINITLSLINLPYPYYDYKLLASIRHNSSSGKWSEIYEHDFQTLRTEPTQAPALTNGSFYLDTSGTSLLLYWASLQPYEFNGPGISYFISEYRENGTSKNTRNLKLEQYSATLEPWYRNTRYEFEVRARNSVGIGTKDSRLSIVPISPNDYDAHKPNHVRGVYSSNNSTLSWEAPQREPLNYTVYWCYSTRDQKHKCTSAIAFEHVPSTARNFTKETPKNQLLRMAVSANYVHINTGMHWPICTWDVDDEFAPLEPSVIEITNTSLTVAFSGECAALFHEHNLKYCRGDQILDDNCTTVAIGEFAERYKIEDLEPYTDYNLRMCMQSDTKHKCSKTKASRTAEGKPTRPTLVRCTHRTNTSMIINWLPPKDPRGQIQHYIITFNDNKEKYEVKHSVGGSDDGSPIAHKLTNLMPHTQYEMFVQAHTQYISERSDPIECMTSVGYPSKPRMKFNSRYEKTILQWTKPSMPAGQLEYYEVAIREINADGNLQREHISYIDGNSCHFDTPICEPSNRFEYAVRAVNALLLDKPQQNNSELQFTNDDNAKDPDKLACTSDEINLESFNQLKKYTNSRLYRHYKSEWDVDKITCSSNDNFVIYFVLFSFFLTCCTILTMHVARRKYNKMSNIHVTLPAALESFCTNPATTKKSRPPSSQSAANPASEHLQELIVIPFSEYVTMKSGRKRITKKPPIPESKNGSQLDFVDPNVGSADYIKPDKCFVEDNQNTDAPGFLNSCKVPDVVGAPTGGYVTVQNLQKPNSIAPPAVQPTNLNDAMLGTSGYVQATDLQKLASATISPSTVVNPIESKPLVSASGYTTMEHLTNVTAKSSDAISNTKPVNLPARANAERPETENVVEMTSKPISGYVTQQDLNILAKDHQNQQQQQHKVL